MTRMLIVAGLVIGLSSVASAQAVPVTVSEWKVTLARDTVRAGSVTFRVKNDGSVVHGFQVLGEGVDKGTPQIAAGQSASLTVNLKPGTYEVYCPMAENSHKMAGMSKKITVVAGEAPAAPKKP
jgi:iron uptake system EfeUOB component EfeO/EfeM